jgi:hypothetical protein
MDGIPIHQSYLVGRGSRILLGHTHPLYEGEPIMAKYVVLCEAYGANDYICGAENEEWEDRNNTFWFTCVECGADNEVVYKWD